MGARDLSFQMSHCSLEYEVTYRCFDQKKDVHRSIFNKENAFTLLIIPSLFKFSILEELRGQNREVGCFPWHCCYVQPPPSPSRKHFPGRKMRTPCQLPLIMVLIAFDVITSIKDESEGG